MINFQSRSFYNKEWDEVYTFYRQGQVVTNNRGQQIDPEFQQMTGADLGEMYLAFQKALIVRSSSNFLIFKKIEVEEDKTDGEGTHLVWRWRKIHEIKNLRGNIFFIPGNVRF